MSKFKVGDYARVVDPCYYDLHIYKPGPYKVVDISTFWSVMLEFDFGQKEGRTVLGFREDCLELAEPKSDPVLSITEDAKTGEGKLDWTLLPMKALEQVVKIMEFGGKKYPRDSWKAKTGEYRQRYQAAAMRHLVELMNGNEIDSESGLPHAAHLACNALFLTDFCIDESYRDNL